ncbi:hypothetical protein [Lysinibacillus xylanilyticus]|uniref:hypothetical protein n=1 Tax=Lysinibacillus xylanilyticus TaxID=582475 RepID=UPI00382D2C9F
MSDYIGTCPYCEGTTYADSVDVGVGFVQCGPYHCENCGASEIGPELDDWCYKDREGKNIYTTGKRRYWSWLRKGKGGKSRSREDYSKRVLRYDAPFTNEELESGFYRGRISPYANTVNGQLVNHIEAKEAYRQGLLDEKQFL